MKRCCALMLLLFFSAFLVDAHGAELRVGSKRFTESYILGEIITQTAAQANEATVSHRQGLGNTGIVFAALTSGAIDVYPDYSGTVAKEILKIAGSFDLAMLNARLAADGLGVAVPLGFNNTYALAMLERQATTLNVKNVSDLIQQPQLKYGLSQEFLGRNDGWPGLAAMYALPGTLAVTGLDHGLAYEAIAAKQIDVTDIYSTDAKIEKFKLRVLGDDRHYFPAYDALLVYRLDLPTRFPKTWQHLQQLKNAIDEPTMIRLNAEVELAGQGFATVAERFLTRDIAHRPAQETQQNFWTRLTAPDFMRLTFQHLNLVFVSLAASILVGIPLGIIASRRPALGQWILSITGVLQTIPSLALLAFLIPVFSRIGTIPALVALFLYGLLPIVRNTYAGLTQIPHSLRESAEALGLPASARLKLVELPLAMGTILAGVKTSAVINVGTATIAAFIGAGGYGERIAAGLALNDNNMLLAGAVPAALLALLVQWGFDLLDRGLISPGLRRNPARN
jgi:osmoprotectant transport system permease protein